MYRTCIGYHLPVSPAHGEGLTTFPLPPPIRGLSGALISYDASGAGRAGGLRCDGGGSSRFSKTFDKHEDATRWAQTVEGRFAVGEVL